MTQKDKELLLTDLCARLPYGVKISVQSWDEREMEYIDRVDVLYSVNGDEYIKSTNEDYDFSLEDIKPYLFPLSSMTEEQFNELKSYVDLNYEHNTLELVEWDNNYKTLEFWLEEIPSYCVIKVFDWLNKNHFDYRGLIQMGLAIDATNKNIY